MCSSENTNLLRLRKTALSLVMSFLVIALLCWLFPYTGDDLGWGGSIGLERLQSWFADYNGRYVGNLIVIAVTRSLFLRSVFVAGVLVGIAYLVRKLLGGSDFSAFWFCLLLLALMPLRMRAQGIVWVSGFTNYALPSFFILAYLVLFSHIFEEGYKPTAKAIVFAALLGFANSLIMENITLMNIAIGLMALVYTRLRHGIWDKAQLAFLFMAILAAILMFSNGAYATIAAGEDYYRDASSSDLPEKVLTHLRAVMLPMVFSKCTVLCAVLALCPVSVLAFKRDNLGRGDKVLMVLAAAFMILFFLLCVTVFAGAPEFNSRLIRYLYYAACTCEILCCLGLGVIAYRRLACWQPLVCFAILAIMLAPLAVVEPIGPRNFLPSYVLEIVFAASFLSSCVPAQLISKVGCALAVATAIAVVPWFQCYWDVYQVNQGNVQHVHEAVARGDTAIEIQTLPHPEAVHCGNPVKENWNDRYKEYYGIPGDVELTVTGDAFNVPSGSVNPLHS